MTTKEDLRIIKTRHALRETLINLMQNKQFEEIKVADICNTALINRSTFYAHYNDKYELLVDVIDCLKMNLLNDLDKNKNIVNTREYYIELIKLILNHINEKNDIYTMVFLNNYNGILMDILTDSVMKDINKRIKNSNLKTNGIPIDIFIKFYLGGITSIGIEWLNNKNKYTEGEMLSYIDSLIPKDIGI